MLIYPAIEPPIDATLSNILFLLSPGFRPNPQSNNQVPDGDTIGRFRALLVEHGLQERLFVQVLELLQARGLIFKKGTIVDSTIIAAPPSTKNREKKRDPDACQMKKGNTWHFGYMAHIGVDQDTGLVHHLEVTAAHVHD